MDKGNSSVLSVFLIIYMIILSILYILSTGYIGYGIRILYVCYYYVESFIGVLIFHSNILILGKIALHTFMFIIMYILLGNFSCGAKGVSGYLYIMIWVNILLCGL